MVATCSSDRTVRIFSLPADARSTKYSLIQELQGWVTSERGRLRRRRHKQPVWQVAWAHPQYGQLLASCSFDGAILLWQHQETPGHLQQQTLQPQAQPWTVLQELTHHLSSVNAIAWAPHAAGLALAAASSDGQVSVSTFDAEKSGFDVRKFDAHEYGVHSVSWAPVTSEAQFIAASEDAVEGGAPVEKHVLRLATGGCDHAVKIWRFVYFGMGPYGS